MPGSGPAGEKGRDAEGAHIGQATSDPPIVGLAASLSDAWKAQLVAHHRQALFLMLVCFLGSFGFIRQRSDGAQPGVELLTYADWANRRGPFEALQLILPDSSGRWPEDPDYNAYAQPLLG